MERDYLEQECHHFHMLVVATQILLMTVKLLVVAVVIIQK